MFHINVLIYIKWLTSNKIPKSTGHHIGVGFNQSNINHTKIKTIIDHRSRLIKEDGSSMAGDLNQKHGSVTPKQ